jgi:hypothetical protein
MIADNYLTYNAIVTASSDSYFPWLLNLIGSVQTNYQGHPQIFVYDLGMCKSFVRELKAIKQVSVKEVPPFVPHWRSCYTWKLWVLNDVPAHNVYYIDAASEVFRPMTDIFQTIERDGYFCAGQLSFGFLLNDIVPSDLLQRLGISTDFCHNLEYFAAGHFGYRKETVYHKSVKKALDLAREGWTLGWSAKEQYRNTGTDFSEILRNCRLFRHDQTLLSLIFHKEHGEIKMQDEKTYAGHSCTKFRPEQVIWASRKRNRELRYINSILYEKKPYSIMYLNRLSCMLILIYEGLKKCFHSSLRYIKRHMINAIIKN